MAQSADYQTLKFWFDVAHALFTLGIAVFVFLLNRHRMDSEAVQKKIETNKDIIDERLDSYGNRLSRVEENIRCAPSHDDIGKLHSRLDTLSEQVNRQTGELKGISNNLGLIHQFLLEESRRRSRDT